MSEQQRKVRSDAGVPRPPKTTPRQDLVRYFLSIDRSAQEQFISDCRMLQEAQDIFNSRMPAIGGSASTGIQGLADKGE